MDRTRVRVSPSGSASPGVNHRCIKTSRSVTAPSARTRVARSAHDSGGAEAPGAAADHSRSTRVGTLAATHLSPPLPRSTVRTTTPARHRVRPGRPARRGRGDPTVVRARRGRRLAVAAVVEAMTRNRWAKASIWSSTSPSSCRASWRAPVTGAPGGPSIRYAMAAPSWVTVAMSTAPIGGERPVDERVVDPSNRSGRAGRRRRTATGVSSLSARREARR